MQKTSEAEYSELLALDLDTVEPSIAGPKRPQDRVRCRRREILSRVRLPTLSSPTGPATRAGCRGEVPAASATTSATDIFTTAAW